MHSKITKIINDLCKTEKSFYVTDNIMTTSFHCFTLANVVHFQLSPFNRLQVSLTEIHDKTAKSVGQTYVQSDFVLHSPQNNSMVTKQTRVDNPEREVLL